MAEHMVSNGTDTISQLINRRKKKGMGYMDNQSSAYPNIISHNNKGR